jgi:ribose-phosphate pyrophosphokinase
VEPFPDGELHVEIQENVHGRDVYLIQPIGHPIAETLLELLLLGDACGRSGALRLTAVIPYCAYARQDRRTRRGEPVSARLVADLLSSRFARIITVDLHNPAIEGLFTASVEHLTAVPFLAEAIRPSLSREEVIVAPDLGAVELAQRYADLLDLPVAYVHKIRMSGREVSVRHVAGEVGGRSPIVVDDIISTGGTMVSAIEALLDRGCLPQVTIAASHALLVENAIERLAALPVRRVFVTDSVGESNHMPFPLEVVSLDHVLADTIGHLYGE